MPKPRDPLANIRIATPCEASWERMAGDERIRHCTSCGLNVYNFAELTREEIRDLIIRTEGRVCGRLYRRADGTLLTRDCPPALQALRRRVSRSGAAVIAALLTLTGCATRSRFGRHHSSMILDVQQAVSPQPAMLRGVVCDESGTLIPGVAVVLRDESTSRENAVVTDVNGSFEISLPHDGVYRVEVMSIGFEPAVKEHVLLKQSEITTARVSLRIDGTTITVGAIVTAPDDSVSSTFSQDLINKLPI